MLKRFEEALIAPMEQGIETIADATLVVEGDRFIWVGPTAELPEEYASSPAESLGGQLVTPGLIDCHTHVVYGGDRAQEFSRRLAGASYAQIAREGGGIQSTVRDTRALTEEALLAQSLGRVDAMLAEGLCTLEIKSGYGLDYENEAKMLRVARQIEKLRPVRIKTSYLALHALPSAYQEKSDEYVQEAINWLKQLHAEGLVDAVDAYCEEIAFSAEQVERLFQAAVALNLPLKCHADQLSNMGATPMAARYKALSVDHLEHALAEDVYAMADQGCVAVLLPGAFYMLRETQRPPVAMCRHHHVPMAIATDCNPGSSPTTSLRLMMHMGCTFFHLTVAEAWAGVTLNAAKALGLSQELGTLSPGKWADFIVWDAPSPESLVYSFGTPCAKRIFKSGLEK